MKRKFHQAYARIDWDRLTNFSCLHRANTTMWGLLIPVASKVWNMWCPAESVHVSQYQMLPMYTILSFIIKAILLFGLKSWIKRVGGLLGMPFSLFWYRTWMEAYSFPCWCFRWWYRKATTTVLWPVCMNDSIESFAMKATSWCVPSALFAISCINNFLNH